MTGQKPITDKRPVLLREDLQYAIKQLSSVFKDNDYKDLGNHATEAIGEMGLLRLAWAYVSILLFFSLFVTLFLTFVFGSCRWCLW